jgi:hypothetical protein
VDGLIRAAVWLLVAVVGLVLLLACTNLASFLVARALDRSQEMAVRRALGATRGALARQMLVESALLGLGGSVMGLLLAVALLKAVLALDLPLPYGMRLDLHLGLSQATLFDWRVLTLTGGAGLVSGLLLGLFPALRGTRAELGRSLAAGTRGSSGRGLKWRNALVVAQISMSLLLLVGAGLFLRSWQRMLAVDPGFGPCADLRPGGDDAGVEGRARLVAPHAEAARATSPRARCGGRRSRVAAAARTVVEQHPLHHRRSRAAAGAGSLSCPAGMGRWRVLRRGRDDRRRRPYVQRR